MATKKGPFPKLVNRGRKVYTRANVTFTRKADALKEARKARAAGLNARVIVRADARGRKRYRIYAARKG